MHLNDFVKVKLTDLGKDIYYHQYDDSLKEYPGLSKYIKPHYPKVDKDGYTEFMLWQFIQLYGNHIGMSAPNVIEPLEIIECEEKDSLEVKQLKNRIKELESQVESMTYGNWSEDMGG